MNTLEDDLRELFLRREDQAPLVQLTEPERMSRRTRRRQVLVAGTAAVVAIAVVGGAVIGIGALARSGRSTPAEPTPPDAAPVVIERGSVEGWSWVLSASTDGRCVALTDIKGSTTLCPTATDAAVLAPDLQSTDIVGVTVRSPGEPGPDSVFVFGILSPRVHEADMSDPAFSGPDEEATFLAPRGIEGDRGFFLGRYDGYPRPIVPTISMWAVDAAGQELDLASVELPSWAKHTTTVLEVVATGTWRFPGDDREWTLQVWRAELTDEICYGIDFDATFCGPSQDPLHGWTPWRNIVRASTSRIHQSGRQSTFVWGLFVDPVVDVRVELRNGRTFPAELYGPPTSYPDAPRVFVFQYRGPAGAHVVGLDAAGNIVGSG